MMSEIKRFIDAPIPSAQSVRSNFVVPDAVECGEPMVDITNCNPRMMFDASYLKAGIEGAISRCYVRESVYKRLCRVLELLPQAYTLLIYDTLRPLSVQTALYVDYLARIQQENPGLPLEQQEELANIFVARPIKNLLKPPSHQTGGAVDLTLCYDGKQLDMGTGFDEFADIAHADYFEQAGMDPSIRNNRRLLHHVMAAAGFTHYEDEWWHFDYGDRMWAAQKRCAPIYAYAQQCDDAYTNN